MNRAWSMSFTHQERTRTVTVIAPSMFGAINLLAERYGNVDIIQARYMGEAILDEEPEE